MLVRVAVVLAVLAAGCGPSADDLRPGRIVRVVRRGDAAPVRGEILHVYDLSNDILHPGRHGGRVVAIFDPSAARAIELVAGGDIARVERLGDAPPGSFAAFARDRGLVVDRLPLDGVWRVHEDGSGYHAHEAGCGDFALDLDRDGPGGAANEDFRAFGQPVVAPVAGRVSVVVAEHPDHGPGTTLGETPANAVFIDLGGGFAVGMYHFARGSVTTAVGADVAPGAPLGRVGNSGTSYAPHLHIGLYWRGDGRSEAGAPRGACHGWSVPFVFRRLYVSARPTGGVLATSTYPKTGVWVSNAPF